MVIKFLVLIQGLSRFFDGRSPQMLIGTQLVACDQPLFLRMSCIPVRRRRSLKWQHLNVVLNQRLEPNVTASTAALNPKDGRYVSVIDEFPAFHGCLAMYGYLCTCLKVDRSTPAKQRAEHQLHASVPLER